MTKNKLSDLNDHLFMTLERLGEEDLNNEELEKEIERSKAISTVAGKIIDNMRLVLDAQKTAAEYNGKRTVNLELLNG
ncbi:putative DNA-directed RNA polymerase [Streptococcus constellatus]|nr:putative DNA-directed RNA polymerase [Streptococcus constellatus]